MSKKHKRKFHQRFNNTVAQPVNDSIANSITTSTAPVMQPAPARDNTKNSISSSVSQAATIAEAHAGEYQIISRDLIKVVILNLIFLAGVLTLYYTNLQSHYLERWFGSILHF